MNGSPYDPTARIGGIDFLRSTLERIWTYADPGRGTVTRRNRLAHDLERFRRLDGILDPGDVSEILDALRLAGPVASLAADLAAASVEDNRRTGDEIHRLRESGWEAYNRATLAEETAAAYFRHAVESAAVRDRERATLATIAARLQALRAAPDPAWEIDPLVVVLDDGETWSSLDGVTLRPESVVTE
jgi:hypothetical protein